MKAADLIVEGKVLSLGKRIGKGGEGEVYTLNDGSSRALKFYTVKDLTQREAKVKAMVRSRLAEKSNLVAFPLAIASHRDGRFAGFLMNLVNGHKPLHELYTPGARKANFPQADYRFLVRTASNIARAVASVHKSGCVIGDINHSSILVSNGATVALIDADSFQIQDGNLHYLCRVGVPEYTPPELQGKKLSETIRTANHDSFGLAIVVFQLLFMGRHPFVGSYSGTGDMPMERAISEYRFAYSTRVNVNMTPPPGAAVLTDFPANVASAIEAAFSRSTTDQRPTAEQWIIILEELERSLRQCTRSRMHYYPTMAKECPWCRMDNLLGMYSFLPYVSSTSSPAQNNSLAAFDLSKVWKDIETVVSKQPKAIHPRLQISNLKPSAEAHAFKANASRTRIVGWLFVCVSGILLLAWPSAWWISVALLFGGLSKAIGNLDLARQTRIDYANCQKQWLAANAGWQRRCGVNDYFLLKETLIEAKESYEALAQERSSRMSEYKRERRFYQLNEFLEGFQIGRAKITGIGPARKTGLASYGIETAADLSKEKVLAVPGFGPSNSQPLLEWKQKIVSKFVYDDKPNSIDQRILQTIQSEIDAKASQLKSTLVSGASNLRTAAARVEAYSKATDPLLARIDAERAQLEVDLIFLGSRVPSS